MISSMSRAAQRLVILSCLVVAGSTHAEITGDSIRMIAGELGLTPPALTMAGITHPAEVNTMLQRLADADAELTALAQAKAAVDQAGQEVSELVAILRSEPGNTQLQNQYQQAAAALDAAHNTLSSAREALFEEATEGFSAYSIEVLTIWRATREHAVPPAFRINERSSEQWKQIESALRAKQRAERMNQPLATHHAQVLDQVSGELAVLQAENLLTVHLATVEQAFEQFSPAS